MGAQCGELMSSWVCGENGRSDLSEGIDVQLGIQERGKLHRHGAVRSITELPSGAGVGQALLTTQPGGGAGILVGHQVASIHHINRRIAIQGYCHALGCPGQAHVIHVCIGDIFAG